ncbi:uncharacterized protein M421DRAFT_417760 [Didymella exigua CBS 183.55]|uniref:Uncharacterized protein n=1 Tax=Didymella exigua CBS 183.55 TaxID=1150837 RepID=A0A6A5RVV4_9PLEO|nr:uncharacterized protein M421DRAFT_417760 [Didymella exigua CBS 183.55]KAF1931108.1 hypothetical protein M421DRAFT_417760 [Didymella exigua CBS 183.55]
MALAVVRGRRCSAQAPARASWVPSIPPRSRPRPTSHPRRTREDDPIQPPPSPLLSLPLFGHCRPSPEHTQLLPSLRPWRVTVSSSSRPRLDRLHGPLRVNLVSLIVFGTSISRKPPRTQSARCRRRPIHVYQLATHEPPG